MAIVNIESEQAVIGCVLLDGTLIKEINLKPNNFHDSRHKNIWWAMLEVDKTGMAIDIVTIVTRMGNGVKKIGGVSYLNDLLNATPSAENFKHYEQHVFEAWRNREAQKILLTGHNDLQFAEGSEALTNIIGDLNNLGDIKPPKRVKVKDAIIEYNRKFENLTGGISGIPTGYTDLDRMTKGLQKSDLVIIAARPSMGKTAFALNVSANACKSGSVAVIFSLEMPTDLLIQRFIAFIGNINHQHLKEGFDNLTTEEQHAYINAIGIIGDWDLYIIDDPSVSVQDIRAELRAIQREHPEQEITCMIDYLQLIKYTGKSESRTQAIGDISRNLKIMARELKLNMVALSQLSRGVEQRQDKRPMMSDIRDSGNIEQDADVIMMLYREDYYDKESENKNIVEVIIAKQRNGPVGTVNLAFVKEYGKFVNLERRVS